jgi:tRNA uridine 5-carboxymethylaminomethyl modification enzyme
MQTSYDIVVIGGGHAGIEAAHASARLGCTTAMVTMDLKAIGRMSCNPAIGGVAKGQLVRDIDALGGLMGLVADQSGIQFRMLNLSKGPAVWGPRAQMDMDDYAARMQAILSATPGLTLIAGELLNFDREGVGEAGGGFRLRLGTPGGDPAAPLFLTARALIITSGTFLGAVMHTGLTCKAGGRIGEAAAVELAQTLKAAGLKTRRLKTGTPPRLAADSLDYGAVEVQHGDAEPFPFSFRTEGPIRNRAVCWITRTGADTHEILREGFDRSPLFTGVIQGVGPRYCPSIEDKIARFAERDSHQLFLEPEGLQGEEAEAGGRIYVNGFSSSLPAEVQDAALRTLPGLKNCRVLRYGYAVEYDSVDATQLHPTFECRGENNPALAGLYFAGQVNGTSGYEEAAAQGLVAGINAALKIQGKDPFLLSRAESYIGVLADDLVNLEIDEPYRMFTSRAEYRLHLRQDNAEDRLLEKGHALGMVDDAVVARYRARAAKMEAMRARLAGAKLTAETLNPFLEAQGGQPVTESVQALPLLRRPEVSFAKLAAHLGFSLEGWTTAEMVAFEATERYRPFEERQQRDIERSRKLAHLRIPETFDYELAKGLSGEALQKLRQRRPLTVGDAGRIAGVTPADISGLIFHLNRK